jgi:hypothetical protein
MGLLKQRWPRASLGLAWLAASLCLVGCRTGGKRDWLSLSGPGWHVEQGQALWRPGRHFPELAGDLVVARGADDSCVLQFSKTPLPLVRAQTTRTNWIIEFLPRQMSFAGRWPPPTRFAWLYLPAALSGQALPPRFRFSKKTEGAWRLENTHSGETLEGYLGP